LHQFSRGGARKSTNSEKRKEGDVVPKKVPIECRSHTHQTNVARNRIEKKKTREEGRSDSATSSG